MVEVKRRYDVHLNCELIPVASCIDVQRILVKTRKINVGTKKACANKNKFSGFINLLFILLAKHFVA